MTRYDDQEYYNPNNTILHRILGGGSTGIIIDYSIFGMVSFTLPLLLLVEIVRHRIDKRAHGKGFYEAVLETLYRELSTLGIVEATIFLVHSKLKLLGVQEEAVFARVHFTLFFVTVFNAIQGVILYMLTCKLVQNRWERMETINLDHYVAIRKQYRTVHEQYDLIRKKKKDRLETLHHTNISNHTLFSQVTWQEIFIKFWYGLRYPGLSHKRNRLLVQVRFHELRVRLIEMHKLPPKFRVSEYLKLCMDDEFIKLVHISEFSWLILMGIMSSMYFFLGIITYTTSLGISDNVVYWITFSILVAFIPLSLIINLKMTSVFSAIMKDKKWNLQEENQSSTHDSTHGGEEVSQVMEGSGKNQLGRFWFGKPGLIINFAQLMQVVYALIFGALLVLGDIIVNGTDGMFILLVIILMISYVFFVTCWCSTILKYTQCLNIGDLVNKKHLASIEAKYILDEAKKSRQAQQDFAAAEKMIAESTAKQTTVAPKKSGLKESLRDTFLLNKKNNEAFMGKSVNLQEIATLVRKPTDKLPEIPSFDSSPSFRHRRKKSLSDGVHSMRFFSSTSLSAENALIDDAKEVTSDTIPIEPPKPRRHRRLKSSSTGVLQMRNNFKELDDTEDDAKSDDGNYLKGPNRFLDSIHESRTMSTFKEEESQISALTMEEDKKEVAKLNTSDKEIHDNKETFKKRSFGKDIATLPTVDETSFLKSFSSENKSVRFLPDEEVANICASETDSIESHKSQLADDHSDGLPDILEIDIADGQGKLPDDRLSAESIRHFFLAKLYRGDVNFILNFIAFFILSMRLEQMLVDTCIIPDHHNTWQIAGGRTVLFWFFLSFLIVFTLFSAITMLLFVSNEANPSIFYAGLYDFVITLASILIFVFAEVERCCDCDGYISLNSRASEAVFSCEYNVDCCGPFGSRLCGGYGVLEPISSIFILRMLRFWVGDYIFRSRRMSHETTSASSENFHQGHSRFNSDGTLKFDLLEEHHNNIKDSGDSCFDYKKGTIAELWKQALKEYPGIVSEHGMFSGLLLEAMLGLSPTVITEVAPEHVPEEPMKYELSQSMQDLPEPIQKVIIAGKIHKPTKFHRRIASVPNLASLDMSDAMKESDHSIEHNPIVVDEFNFPSSTLIRSMRRCQCLFLPLIDEWITVDVVLTKDEIVWLDAHINVEDVLRGEYAISKRDAVKEAITATKGGKGLRLCDVATGRTILGHFQLKDIDYIKVHRSHVMKKGPIRWKNFKSFKGKPSDADRLEDISKEEIKRADVSSPPGPFHDNSKEEDEEANQDEDAYLPSEYWYTKGVRIGSENSLEDRWNNVTEDILKIYTVEGTLMLRYVVDLIASESAMNIAKRQEVMSASGKSLSRNSIVSEDEIISMSEGALLWCQTIARICGRSQLSQQDLPHFGKGRQQELMDFVCIEETRGHRRRISQIL